MANKDYYYVILNDLNKSILELPINIKFSGVYGIDVSDPELCYLYTIYDTETYNINIHIKNGNIIIKFNKIWEVYMFESIFKFSLGDEIYKEKILEFMSNHKKHFK